MMWFPRFKAIAAALPIIGFGLGSSLCTVLHNMLAPYHETEFMFWPLVGIYALPMLLGCILLRKPTSAENAIMCDFESPKQVKTTQVPYSVLIKDNYFWRCWLFMLLNISAGLCLIPLAKQFMTGAGYTASLISIILIGMGLMNGAGRFIFALWSDVLKKRINILLLIALISIGLMVTGIVPMLIGISLLLIPACYGAGFSCIPAIVHDHYGMKNVSTVHGAVLSAWGVAGLIGNQLSLVAMNIAGLTGVIALIVLMHGINIWNVAKLKKIGACS